MLQFQVSVIDRKRSLTENTEAMTDECSAQARRQKCLSLRHRASPHPAWMRAGSPVHKARVWCRGNLLQSCLLPSFKCAAARNASLGCGVSQRSIEQGRRTASLAPGWKHSNLQSKNNDPSTSIKRKFPEDFQCSSEGIKIYNIAAWLMSPCLFYLSIAER